MQWEYLLSKEPDWGNLGAEGWELVGVRPNGECVFKRAESPAAERFTDEQTARALKGTRPLCNAPRLLNPELAALARRVGHTQMLIVCDRGFPVPQGLPLGVLDLSVTADVPTVPQLLNALLPELPHDRIIVAREMREKSPKRFRWHRAQPAPVEVHPHQHFKHLTREAVACIRTGDATPYANIIIVGG